MWFSQATCARLLSLSTQVIFYTPSLFLWGYKVKEWERDLGFSELLPVGWGPGAGSSHSSEKSVVPMGWCQAGGGPFREPHGSAVLSPVRVSSNFNSLDVSGDEFST